MPQLIADLDHISLLALGVAAAVLLIIVLRWMGERVAPSAAGVPLEGDGSFDYTIAGTSDHQPVLGRIAGHPDTDGHDCTAELVPDMARTGELRGIWVLVDGARVGHILPAETAMFHAVMGGRRGRCEAVIAVHADGELVVRLDTVWPPRLA
ncbi:hypothetical protein [Ancylobacter radicis]|uniref:HIRAN domain-containing protein n=1 Tax=Ancylobacter radicis TaxID=2836179 RepID=A0ABS5R3R6_9HYPH|nr:hypothetical protein [Ancylobacter radicis]MBS9476289.1 hypothetical protein [Ancylobacter radicis]